MNSVSWIIRKAVAQDSPVLAAIAEESYSIYLSRMDRKPFPMVDDYAAHVAEGYAHVLEDAAGVQGYVIIMHCPDGSLLLDNIAVRPSCQKCGYGRALMDFAENFARTAGAGSIRLYTNEAMFENLDWYPRLGYQEYDRYTENGYKRVYFVKKIN